MLGGLEIVGGAALIGWVGSKWQKQSKDDDEKKVASELYERYFNESLPECDQDAVQMVRTRETFDPRAEPSIRAIESYQRDRKGTFFSVQSDDARMRILEEMKQWLRSLSSSETRAQEIQVRLEYCRQLLMRLTVFEGKNSKSFLNTIALICLQLESALKQSGPGQWSGLNHLNQIKNCGQELIARLAPVLYFTVPDDVAVPERSRCKLHDSIEFTSLLEWAGADTTRRRAINEKSDVGRLICALLRSKHVQKMGSFTADDSSSETPEFKDVLKVIEQKWETDDLSKESGVLPWFRKPEYRELRSAYLQLLKNMDDFSWFVCSLAPILELAGVAGDLSMSRLHEPLQHLLKELERSMIDLRTARLEVTNRAKRHLQDISKRLYSAQKSEVRWAQGLRHMDETRLDELHTAIANELTEVRMLATEGKASELIEQAKETFSAVIGTFQTPDFQARCAMPLPPNVAGELRMLTA